MTFAAGETSQSFAFSATQDTDNDDGESVRLGFGSLPDAGVSAGTPAATTVNITDDDVPAVTVQFSQGSYTVAEGATQSVTVTLSADPERTVVVPIVTVNQGTASDADYSGVPSSVTFAAGGDVPVVRFQRHAGHRQRRRGERAAGVRFPARRRGQRRDACRDDCQHHRR